MKKLTAILAGLVFLAFTGFASAEYTDNEDGTITDSRTNLMWQKTPANGDWNTANSYCSQSGTGGYGDWRMPTLAELQVLVDTAYDHPALDPVFACSFPWRCWTSSVEGDSAWVVDFIYGQIVLVGKSYDSSMVRCVRGATTPPPTGCISIGNDLSISIPCVEYNGVQYILKLQYYDDPALPPGLYWKMESAQGK
jgi:hypothetical protein